MFNHVLACSHVQICTHAQSAEVTWMFNCVAGHAKIKDGDMTWTESESSLKDNVRLIVKHQTNENILARLLCRWNPSKEYQERHRRRLKVHSRKLLTYLLTYLLITYINSISVLTECSGAQLRWLENVRDSCCTLHIVLFLYMNPTGFMWYNYSPAHIGIDRMTLSIACTIQARLFLIV